MAKKRMTFERRFREEFNLQEGADSETFLSALGKTVRQEPLMVTLVWSLSGLVFRTTADMENVNAVRQLSTNLRSVAEQLDSIAFTLLEKDDKNDSGSIPESTVGEAK